jgi:hypothetical protein
MNFIPNDLNKVHQKYEELIAEKGKEFAHGFLTYMIEVDYHKSNPEQVLRKYLWTWHSELFSHEIDAILNHQVESDVIKGFEFAQEYSQQMNYTYKRAQSNVVPNS